MKVKTRKSAYKRIKKKKNCFIRKKAYKSHLLRKKSSKRLRRLSVATKIKFSEFAVFKLMNPYSY